MYATPINEPPEKSKKELTGKGWWPNIRRAKEHTNQHLFNSVFIVVIFRCGQNTFGQPFILKCMCVEVNLSHLFLNYFLKRPTFYFTRTDFQEVLWYPQPPAKPAQKVWSMAIEANLLKTYFKKKIKISKETSKRIFDLSVEIKHKT